MENKCDPRQPYKVWLGCFDDSPEDSRPTFTYRRINGTEWLRSSAALDALDAGDNEASMQRVMEAACIGLVGWSNQIDLETGEAIDFDPSKLVRVIDHVEAQELIQTRMQHGRLSANDKKKLESQRLSSSESSARTVAAESASSVQL